MDLGSFCIGAVQLWDNILGMGPSDKYSSAEVVWMVLSLRSCLAATEIAFQTN